MVDLIDRQMAISLVHKNYDTILDFKSDGRTIADSFEDIINTLPPAQPEIIRCKDCKYHGYNEYFHKLGLMTAFDNNFCSYAERKEQDDG